MLDQDQGKFLDKANLVGDKIEDAKPFKDITVTIFLEGNSLSFSINFMEVNNGVSVYGHKTKNANEKLVFKEIADELLKAVS